ncbi:MAG: YifB family Mg chelatase-like AAA ATPase [Agarilytica sp.]
MSLAIIHTRALMGISAPAVSVEVHLSNGLPAFTIVGLPETAVRESKDRVRSALLNSHFEFPQRRITVNLAPADLPKEGGRFDLAIALGILAASEQVPSEKLKDHEFLGELALSGEIRAVRGAISTAVASGKSHRSLVLPQANNDEASLCQSTHILLADNLLKVCAYLHQRTDLNTPKQEGKAEIAYPKDLSDVKGQLHARRALEIAATGGHNMLLYGPPGTGKSMLASRLPGVLPQMEEHEVLDVAAIRSLTLNSTSNQWQRRPYRSPHHSSSAAALVGGGSRPSPGEISLAHKGVLFLDELPEFPRHVLEVLREPLESGHICISRANAQVEYPADFQLVAAMNPCPCGFHGDASGRCLCTPAQVKRYRDKISGPLLDRIDLHVHVKPVPVSELQQAPEGESSACVQKRVCLNHAHQIRRQGVTNAALEGKQLHEYCALQSNEKSLLTAAIDRLKLSARAYDRILKVARTIADMSDSANIQKQHINEALSYRNLDRGTPI